MGPVISLSHQVPAGTSTLAGCLQGTSPLSAHLLQVAPQPCPVSSGQHFLGLCPKAGPPACDKKKGVPLPGISTRPGPGIPQVRLSPGTENDTLQRQNQRSLGMALRGCRGSSTCPVSRGEAHSRSPWSTGPLSAPTPICLPCVALPPPPLPSLLKETNRGCWEKARRTRTTHAPRVPSKFSPARGASALRSARFPGWAEFHPHSRPVPLHPLAH